MIWKIVIILTFPDDYILTFPGGSDGKASACRRPGFDPWVGKIPWRRKWQTHSSTLAWRIPWREEPSRLQSMGSQRVGHDWATSLHFPWEGFHTVLITNFLVQRYQLGSSVHPWNVPGKSTGVGLPFPSPGNLLHPGIESGSPALQADAFTIWAMREAPNLS